MLDFRGFHAEKPTWHFLFRLILRLYKCVRGCDLFCGNVVVGLDRFIISLQKGTAIYDFDPSLDHKPPSTIAQPNHHHHHHNHHHHHHHTHRHTYEVQDAMDANQPPPGLPNALAGPAWGEQRLFWLEYPIISAFTFNPTRRSRLTPFALSWVSGERMLLVFRGTVWREVMEKCGFVGRVGGVEASLGGNVVCLVVEV